MQATEAINAAILRLRTGNDCYYGDENARRVLAQLVGEVLAIVQEKQAALQRRNEVSESTSNRLYIAGTAEWAELTAVRERLRLAENRLVWILGNCEASFVRQGAMGPTYIEDLAQIDAAISDNDVARPELISPRPITTTIRHLSPDTLRRCALIAKRGEEGLSGAETLELERLDAKCPA